MKIGCIEKLSVVLGVYRVVFRLPKKYILNTILYPLDSTRYTEFAYFLKYIKDHKVELSGKKILDISSPFMMSYILAEQAQVTKTDINPEERRSIQEHANLLFKEEDGTKLSFADQTFDVSYSISVIEHIYNGSKQTLKEMIRVTKPGGLIYASFPVSASHKEEWIEDEIYSHQFKDKEKTFFQYRFSEADVQELLNLEGVQVVSKDIYWERRAGAYDAMTKRMRRRPKNKYLDFIYMALLNWWYGYTLLENTSRGFDRAQPLGNMSVILQKQ